MQLDQQDGICTIHTCVDAVSVALVAIFARYLINILLQIHHRVPDRSGEIGDHANISSHLRALRLAGATLTAADDRLVLFSEHQILVRLLSDSKHVRWERVEPALPPVLGHLLRCVDAEWAIRIDGNQHVGDIGIDLVFAVPNLWHARVIITVKQVICHTTGARWVRSLTLP